MVLVAREFLFWELDLEMVMDVVTDFPPMRISFLVIFMDFICNDAPFMNNYYEELHSVDEESELFIPLSLKL